MADGEFTGKVVVVTGAGSGIGRASAVGFAADGARVVVNDVNAETASATVELIESAGGDAVAHPADVGDSAAVDALIDNTVERFGQLDVLHNNAGYGLPGLVATTTDEVMAEMLRVNLCGVLYGTWCRAPAHDRAGLRRDREHRVERGVGGATANGRRTAAPRPGSSRSRAAPRSRTAATACGRWPSARVPSRRPRSSASRPIPTTTRADPDPTARSSRGRRRAGRFLASDRAGFLTGVAISLDGGLSAKLSAPFLTPDEILE